MVIVEKILKLLAYYCVCMMLNLVIYKLFGEVVVAVVFGLSILGVVGWLFMYLGKKQATS